MKKLLKALILELIEEGTSDAEIIKLLLAIL